jgi:uncharacterized protein with GYD domain
MASYLILFRFTPEGITHIRSSLAAVEAAKQTFQALGAEVKAFYGLMGRYDTMFLVEAPGDGTIATAALALRSLGQMQSEILRAFPEEEYQQVLAALPGAQTTR